MSEQNLSPQEKNKPAVDKSDEVIVMSKVTFNYIIIAITFLVVGIAIGLFGLNGEKANTSAVIDEDQLREVLVSVLNDSNLNLGGGTASDRFALVDDDPYMGEEDAPIVIVEFSDFFCTFCKRHFDQTFIPLLENYGQYIRYVYRDYAQLTPESQPAAIAAQCANEQGAFWDFHNDFFNNQQALGRDFYIATAEKFGLNIEDYTACLDDNRYFDEVQIDLLDGQLEGVRGTPGFFVNGQFLSGAQPYQLFERLIQKELTQAGISYQLNVPVDTSDANSEAESTTEAASSASDIPETNTEDLEASDSEENADT